MTLARFSLRPDNLYFRSSEAGVACPETSQRWKLDQILEIGQSYIATRARGDRARPPIPTDRARNHHLRGDRAEKTWVRTVWSGRVGTEHPISPPNGIKTSLVRRSPEPSPFQMITGICAGQVY